VATDIAFSESGFSVSQTGMLVFQSTTDTVSDPAWFDSAGKELGQLGEAGYGEPRISPDGRFIAFDTGRYPCKWTNVVANDPFSCVTLNGENAPCKTSC
jgi:WD40-like Beta Propeller Repeat